MEKKLQKLYLANYNLLIAQDLWQVNDQILFITFLEEFIKFNATMEMKIQTRAELNIKIVGAASNTQALKMV